MMVVLRAKRAYPAAHVARRLRPRASTDDLFSAPSLLQNDSMAAPARPTRTHFFNQVAFSFSALTAILKQLIYTISTIQITHLYLLVSTQHSKTIVKLHTTNDNSKQLILVDKQCEQALPGRAHQTGV